MMKPENLGVRKAERRVFGTTSEEAVISRLKKDKTSYLTYHEMSDEWKKRFMDFCTGKKTLPLMYDSTFKFVFNPDVHSDRLSDLISEIIGQRVKVKAVLPNEESFLSGEKMVIMDIIVQLEDGSIADVEIQKNPYMFAGERISCYTSDLILRQYSRLKHLRGKDFKYGDLRKVYTIVIYEKTGKNFKNMNAYIHRGTMQFNTGLEIKTLEGIYLVALDEFRNIAYHKENSKLAGWLSLLVTESTDDAEQLIKEYPWLEEIYREIASIRGNLGGVIEMYSDMLLELDRNTMQYMIDVQNEKLEMQQEKIETQQEKIERQLEQIEINKKKLETQQETIETQQEKIETQDKKIELLEGENLEKDARIKELVAELERLRK